MTARPPFPDGLRPYRRTAEFDETTMPAALRRAHSTRAGVWAKLHILEGRLAFRDEVLETERELGPGVHAVIRPQEKHAVTPLGRVRFFVEFYEPAGVS